MRVSPTLRQRWRYLAVTGLSFQELRKAVRDAFGRFYASIIGLKLIEESEKIIIVRVVREFEDYVRAALVLYRSDAPVYVLRASGTIKTLKKKLGQYGK